MGIAGGPVARETGAILPLSRLGRGVLIPPLTRAFLAERRSRFEKPALCLSDPRVDGSERGGPGDHRELAIGRRRANRLVLAVTG